MVLKSAVQKIQYLNSNDVIFSSIYNDFHLMNFLQIISLQVRGSIKVLI